MPTNPPELLKSIKEALLPSIADLFETHSVKTDEKLKAVKHEILHGVTILMEQMDKKIDTAIELASIKDDSYTTTEDHSKRIGKLETEVRVIKKAIKEQSR